MNSWVLLTAMPPTRGHEALVEFARGLGGLTHVVLCTQPDEPLVEERRVWASELAYSHPYTRFHYIGDFIQQVPDGDDPEFWAMWGRILTQMGAEKGDCLVASEPYGVRLCEELSMTFMPYDPQRDILDCSATQIRENPIDNFSLIAPDFQPYLRKTITTFGAESVGKTTLSKMLAEELNGYWIAEWARPYLETVGSEITPEVMMRIAHGQRSLQASANKLSTDKPFIIQDTDLFSTVGYWEMYDPQSMPAELVDAAKWRKSDLYLICASNIPFEKDPLRYGGDKRESEDEYWIELAERENLNYIYVEQEDKQARVEEVKEACLNLFTNINYERVK